MYPHTDLTLIIPSSQLNLFYRSKADGKNRQYESIIYTIHCESRFSLTKIMKLPAHGLNCRSRSALLFALFSLNYIIKTWLIQGHILEIKVVIL